MPSADPNMRDVEKVANLVRDSGGRIIGRTRLQKIAYLLELTGLGDGFSFEYRHYGPFSSDLADAARKAALLDLIDEAEHQASWGGFYSVFSNDRPADDGIPPARVKLARVAANADPIELELAATAAFLASESKSPWEETAERKPEKASEERLVKARALYQTLRGIETPVPLPEID